MSDKTKDPKDIGRVRGDTSQSMAVPGIRRYQFFTNVGHRMLTEGLNRVSLFGITGYVAVDMVKALLNSDPQTLYCYECRACYGTQDSCPVGIMQQGDMVIASRCGDYRRFLDLGGMRCIRCGNCTSYCVQNLDMPRIFATGQHTLIAAVKRGQVPENLLRDALARGLVNREFIDTFADVLGLNA